MLCSSRARVHKNGVVVWEILLLVFYLFLQKQEVLSVGFKQSKKKKKEIFQKLLRSSLLSSKPSSFDSAEREREVTDSLLLVLVFLRLFL